MTAQAQIGSFSRPAVALKMEGAPNNRIYRIGHRAGLPVMQAFA